MNTMRTIAKRKERGAALLIAMMALLLLAAIGIGFMFMADTENSVNNNYRDSQKAYFASRAGLENVRALLAAPGFGSNPPKGILYDQASLLAMPSAGSTGVLYVLNPALKGGTTETVDPSSGIYGDDELCQEQYADSSGHFTTPTAGTRCSFPASGVFATTTPSTSDIPNIGTAGALPFKWVRITNKQNFMGLLAATGTSQSFTVDGSSNYNYRVCFDGTKEIAIQPNLTCQTQGQSPAPPTDLAEPVWLVTSLAITPGIGNNPGSRRVTQMELANAPPLNVPGTISTQAPITFNGASVTVNAYDYCSCTCTTNGNGNNATTTCTDKANATPGSCNGSHHAVYTANTVSAGQANAVSSFGNSLGGNASVQNVNPFPYNISQLISQYQSTSVAAPFNSSCSGTANFTSSPPVYAQCGTQSGQTFGGYPTTDSNGNLIPSTATPQVTYVAGSVHLSSNPTGAGVLIIDGDVRIDGGLNFYGLILVRGSVTFSGGGSSGTNINGAILSGEDITNGTASSDTVGGNVKLQYDLCALKNTASHGPPRLLATHEIQY